MTLDEFCELYPKIKRSERGRVVLVKPTSDAEDSYEVLYRLKETGTQAHIQSPDQWPLPKNLR